MNPVVIGNATLYHAEALSVLATLPDESVDAVFTDPPYSSGGMFRGDRMASTHCKYSTNDSASAYALPGFSGDNRDQMAYLFWVATWMSELRRISKPGAICGLFTDWRQLPTTSIALQMGGFVWRGIFVWNKPNARPMLGRFTNACEYVVWGTNGPREIEGDALPGFFTSNPPPSKDREHITQKPVDVMRLLLRSTARDAVILDPFMGSGTTGVACANLGRKFVGIEMDTAHFDAACERIDQAQRQQTIFDAVSEPLENRELFEDTNADQGS